MMDHCAISSAAVRIAVFALVHVALGLNVQHTFNTFAYSFNIWLDSNINGFHLASSEDEALAHAGAIFFCSFVDHIVLLFILLLFGITCVCVFFALLLRENASICF